MNGPGGGICVVHLVWAPLGMAPFQRFLASYRRYPGRIDHRLLIVFNGFAAGADFTPYRRELEEMIHEELILPEPVQDIQAYFAATASVDNEYVCFLNSYTEILDPLWLLKMHACLQPPGVGLVGATGSWGSPLSHTLLKLGLPSAYHGMFDRFAPNDPPPDRGRVWQALRVLRGIVGVPHLLWCLHHLYYFPAYHIRTNAFMLRREAMLQLRRRDIRTKKDAYLFESGRHSLTSQTHDCGKSVLVVGRDGIGYEKESWPESGTFWQGEQANLLVADNQTCDYAKGNAARRRFLSSFAWGKAATP